MLTVPSHNHEVILLWDGGEGDEGMGGELEGRGWKEASIHHAGPV